MFVTSPPSLQSVPLFQDGLGPEAKGEQIDGDVVNAGKIPVVKELPGASYRSRPPVTSPNWETGAPGAFPVVGGAMDLAAGAKDVFVMVTLLSAKASPNSWSPALTRSRASVASPGSTRTRPCNLEELPQMVRIMLKAAALTIEA